MSMSVHAPSVDAASTVSVEELRHSWAETINGVYHAGGRVTITRRGRAVGVIVPETYGTWVRRRRNAAEYVVMVAEGRSELTTLLERVAQGEVAYVARHGRVRLAAVISPEAARDLEAGRQELVRRDFAEGPPSDEMLRRILGSLGHDTSDEAVEAVRAKLTSA